jgi:hypothetical protein
MVRKGDSRYRPKADALGAMEALELTAGDARVASTHADTITAP